MDYSNTEFAMPGHESGEQLGKSLESVLRHAADLMVLKKVPEAIEVLEGLTKEHPSYVAACVLLATAYIDEKRIPDAKREYDRLLKLGSKQPMLAVRLGARALGMRLFDDAIHYFGEAKRLGAEPGDWNVFLGNALRHIGRLSEAEEVYQDITPDSDPCRYDLFFGLSAIRLQQKRYQEAMELSLHALQTNKPKTRAIYYIGLAFMHLGDIDRAILSFKNFARMQPNKVAPYRWLERLTRKAGDDKEADAYLLKARDMLDERRMKRMEKLRQAAE